MLYSVDRICNDQAEVGLFLFVECNNCFCLYSKVEGLAVAAYGTLTDKGKLLADVILQKLTS